MAQDFDNLIIEEYTNHIDSYAGDQRFRVGVGEAGGSYREMVSGRETLMRKDC